MTSTSDRLRQVAAQLLPGDGRSPAAIDLPDFTVLLGRAMVALGPDREALDTAVSRLPEYLDLTVLEQFSCCDAEAFEVIAATVAGAYFMSAQVLESIGYVTGERSAARFDLAADELATGLLDPVLERSHA